MAESQSTGKQILGSPEIARSLFRIAHEIVERNRGVQDLLLLGIPTGGVPLAARLSQALAVAAVEDAQAAGLPEPPAVPAGTLDITMYRDDLGRHPIRVPQPTRIPGGRIEGRTVVLVDDVLYSGRTIRAALDALGSIGRADAVQLAVLVDRPSYRVKPGQTIQVRPPSQVKVPFQIAAAGAHRDVLPPVPDYLTVDLEKLSATLVRRPKRDEVPVTCDVQMVVEYYSR